MFSFQSMEGLNHWRPCMRLTGISKVLGLVLSQRVGFLPGNTTSQFVFTRQWSLDHPLIYELIFEIWNLVLSKWMIRDQVKHMYITDNDIMTWKSMIMSNFVYYITWGIHLVDTDLLSKTILFVLIIRTDGHIICSLFISHHYNNQLILYSIIHCMDIYVHSLSHII